MAVMTSEKYSSFFDAFNMSQFIPTFACPDSYRIFRDKLPPKLDPKIHRCPENSIN